nr:MAG TPA: hypothetical protein [Caudoviricetes sp.]
MTLIYLPITSTKATPQVNAYRTINVQLPPLELKILFAILSCWTYRQWGVNSHGIVTLPVSCQSINRIVSAHSGISFVDTKVRETNPLIKFTLDVGGNTGDFEDAQWIAVGK